MLILPTLLLASALMARLPVATDRDTLVLRFDIRALAADSTRGVEVRLTLPPSPDSIRLVRLPVEWAGWSSLQSNILELRAESDGARIEAGKDSSEYRLIAPPGKPAIIRWLRRPTWKGQMPSGAHNLSDFGGDWYQLIGHDAFVLPQRKLSTPIRATFAFRELPEGAVVATSFGTGARRKDTLVVVRAQLGDLQQAVYLVGNAPRTVRLVHVPTYGKGIDVAIRGALAIPDSVVVDGARRVVTAERAFWSDKGPSSYLVTVGEANRGTLAGVRLTNAFVADIDPKRPMDDGVLKLLGHEMMHEWLGGKLHDAAGVPDGHVNWFTEGLTDYASTRVLWHAGVISDSSYLASVNRWLHEYAMSPARDLTWAEVEARHWKDANVQRQPYLRGALLGLRVDALARARADSTKRKALTVDDALRAMMTSDHGKPVELTDRTILTGLAPVLGAARMKEEIETMQRGGTRMPIPPALLGPCFAQQDADVAMWEPGFDIDLSLSARSVRGVRSGSRAAQAGLADGMQIRSASIYRGDITKQIEMRTRSPGDTADHHIVYMPLSDATERVTVLSQIPGCRPTI